MGRFIYATLLGLYCYSSTLFAMDGQASAMVTLSFSDQRQHVTDLHAINATLNIVGVHLSRLPLPAQALSILKYSTKTKLSEQQKSKLLNIFSLSRKDLLDQISMAGRQPAIPGGGSLTSGEVGVAPYPKVYDLKAMSPQNLRDVQHKFGKLHINSAENGAGVDEVMMLASGGPWTWYFLLKDNVVAKLSLQRILPSGPGWRLSYPGLTPHGAYMDAADGICIAYIFGPQTWVMRYDAPGTKGASLLGKNPWIDFANNRAM